MHYSIIIFVFNFEIFIFHCDDLSYTLLEERRAQTKTKRNKKKTSSHKNGFANQNNNNNNNNNYDFLI
jgi:hypothetical protein